MNNFVKLLYSYAIADLGKATMPETLSFETSQIVLLLPLFECSSHPKTKTLVLMDQVLY